MFKDLKAINIENADHKRLGGVGHAVVDGGHNVVEDPGVEGFGEGVADPGGLVCVLRGLVLGGPGRAGLEVLVGEAHLEVVRRELEEVGGILERLLVLHLGRGVARKLDVAQPQDGRNNPPHLRLVPLRDTNGTHRLADLRKVRRVVHPVHGGAAALGEVVKEARVAAQSQFLPLVGAHPREEVVEDMEITLVLALEGHPRTLQEERRNLPPNRGPALKLDLQVLAKPRRIVVAHRLRVPEAL
mmetsp:Transcript_13860/g.39445  ORF Transcript_13860/g.39445 Transcript_13860/m.39445 type:complete len:243 (+) Transcript_13860:1073-1801(+)